MTTAIDLITTRDTAKARLINAIHSTCGAMRGAKAELSDLSPRFWVALLDVERAAVESELTIDNPPDHLEKALKAAYPQLGAPGDFGYGSPHGDALAALYRAWTDFIAARKAVETSHK